MENKSQQPNKWQWWSKRCALACLIAIGALILVVIIGYPRDLLGNSLWVDSILTGLVVVIGVSVLGFLVSKLALFVSKRRASKENFGQVIKSGNIDPIGWRAHKKLIVAGGILLILVMLGLFGFAPENCKDTACFIAAAESGRSAHLTLTDTAGTTWSYEVRGTSGSGQTFTKTLLDLDDTEPEVTKNLLQGTSMTCEIRSNFDERFLTSLFYGVGTNCSGELKENLGTLLFLL